MAASVDLKTALPSPNESASTLSLAVDRVLPRVAMFDSKKFRIASLVTLVAIVVVIGALTVIEFLFKLNLHIDQLLFASAMAGDGQFPGRMAFAAALDFVLLGSALLFINEKTKGRSLTDVLAGSAAAITLLA